MIYFEYIFICDVGHGSKFIFLHKNIKLFHHHLLKIPSCYPYSTELPLNLCQKSICLFVCYWTFYSVLLNSLSILMPVLQCFNYYSFIISPEIQKYQISNFVILFQSCLTVVGPLYFYMNFRISWSRSIKHYWDSDWDCFASLGQFGENWHLNNSKSSGQWTQYISPVSYIFFQFSQQWFIVLSAQILKIFHHICPQVFHILGCK